ncbi:MAG: hypothetical protein ACI379_08975 [Nocardioides sp.]|uniref:hypothetical protein n=1 Tax=Nocardioides sp. TaxID=35761 RepID=UPI003F0E692C
MVWLLVVLLLLWVALGPWVPVAAAVLMLVPRIRWWVLDRVRLSPRVAGTGAAVLAVVVGVGLVLPAGMLPVPRSPGIAVAPSYLGRPAIAAPVNAADPPQHPHLARNGTSGAANDAWGTGAYAWEGPLGREPEVDTGWYGLEQCAASALDAHDRLVALCRERSGPTLRILDPGSMRVLASKELPEWAEDEEAGQRVCASAVHVDAEGRVVLATTDQRVLAVTTADGDDQAQLSTADSWDLAPYVPQGDCLVALLPDWGGRLWWVSRQGLVGTLASHSGDVRVLDLDEQVTNGLVTDEDGGTYVVTDRALYRLTSGAEGMPQVSWRRTYDRGTEAKKGQVVRGSGTGPVLLGAGVVAFADNAEPRMNVVFVRRDDGSEICRHPVFEEGASATEASLVSVGGGVVVENNHGYTGPLRTVLGRATSPGFARVDLDGTDCSVAWTSDAVAASGAPKVSWANGLLYAYTKRPTWWGVSAWYVTAFDVHTGRRRFSVRTGTGMAFNNDHAPLTLTPDGSLYVATLTGLVRVRDRR